MAPLLRLYALISIPQSLTLHGWVHDLPPLRCPSLAELHLSSPVLQADEVIAAIWHCGPRLVKLSIHVSVLKATLVSGIGMKCSQLEDLHLQDSPDHWHSPARGDIDERSLLVLLQGCPRLRHLSLARDPHGGHAFTELNAVALAMIPNMLPGLQTLSLSGAAHLEDATLHTALRCCSGLTTLRLQSTSVTDMGLYDMPATLPLTCLNLSNSARLDDEGVAALLQCCPALQDVSLAGCWQVGDLAACALADHAPDLRVAVLNACALTPEGLHALARSRARLRKLCMRGCQSLPDFAIRDLLTSDRHRWLTSLDITGTRLLTDKSVAELATHLPFLESLKLRNCQALTNLAVRALACSRVRSRARVVPDGVSEAVEATTAAATAAARAAAVSADSSAALEAGVADAAAGGTVGTAGDTSTAADDTCTAAAHLAAAVVDADMDRQLKRCDCPCSPQLHSHACDRPESARLRRSIPQACLSVQPLSSFRLLGCTWSAA